MSSPTPAAVNDDVIHFLVLLTQSCSANDVRAAIQGNEDVLRFFCPALASPTTVVTGHGYEENDNRHAQEIVAICELLDETTGRPEVFATTDPAAFFHRLGPEIGHRDSSRPNSNGGPVHMSPATKALSGGKLPVSCTLVSKRHSSDSNTGSRAAPLGVRDLYIQSMDLSRPLDVLQQWLQDVYEPMLSARKHQLALRSSVQDLLTGIRSANSALPEVNLLRYVPEDLIELCAVNPNLEVPQLVDRLGEQAKDPSYLRRVLQVRNRCTTVLPLEDLLSGRKEGNQQQQQQQQASQQAASLAADASVYVKDGSDNANSAAAVGRVVQEKMAYWESASVWIEDVTRQLQSREWRLVHRLLGHRVETSYAPEYVTYSQRVREYIKFLQGIPERQLATLPIGAPDSCQRFARLVDDMFTAAMRPSSYPGRLLLPLLSGIADELAAVWVRIAEERHIVETDEQARARGEEAASGPSTALQSLRDVETVLDGMQQHYAQCVATVRMNAAELFADSTTGSGSAAATSASGGGSSVTRRFSGVSPAGVSPTTATAMAQNQHPKLTALMARVTIIREWIEQHFLLQEQLRSVFSTKVQLPDQGGGAQHNDKASGRSSTSAPRRLPGEEFVEDLQEAYEMCVSTLCDGNRSRSVGSPAQESLPSQMSSRALQPLTATASTSSQNTNPLASPSSVSARSTLLWQTTIPAQRKVREAIASYRGHVQRCDDQVAQMVSHLLSTEQSMGLASAMSGKGSSASGATSPGFGIRMFRIFANFRFLQLPKTQRVVKGYEGPLAEKILAEVKYLQEEYFSVAASKRESRLGVARYHLSAGMAQIGWERELLEALRQCIVRHDYVSENGWHQLLSLRNVEHYWRLDEKLAEFLGYSVEDLVTPTLHQGSIVHGCAYGLAYLSLLCAEDEQEWSADPTLRVAQELVQTQSPSSLQAAKDRLLGIGAGTVTKGRRKELSDIRTTCNSIRKRLDDKVLAWSEEARKRIAALPSVDPNSMVLRGQVLRAVELNKDGAVIGHVGGGDTANPHLNASLTSGPTLTSPRSTATSPSMARSPSRGAGGGGSTTTPPSAVRGVTNTSVSAGGVVSTTSATHVNQDPLGAVDVSFPWEIFTMAADMRFLESAGLVQSAQQRQSTGAVKDFLKANEQRGRLAECLKEVIRVYYSAVNHEDETLVLLATEEYRDVNECLMRGFALRWCDDTALTQYVQALAERMLAFTKTVQQVRENTEAVYSKIKAFHVRAFHPEAIVQRVKEIRSIVSNLSLHSVNTHLWVRRTQPLLDAALRDQMTYLLHGWTLDFLTMRTDARYLDRSAETEVFRLKPLRVRMRVVYKEVRLESPAAAWRSHWIDQLNRYLQWLDVLPRLYNEEDVRKTVTVGPGAAAAGSSVAGSDRSMSVSSLRSGANNRQAAMAVQSFLDTSRSGNLSVLSGHSSGSGSSSHVKGTHDSGDNVNRGYQYLLERLPAAALREPLEAIEQCITDAIEEEKEWRQSQEFLNLDVVVMQQRFGNDLRRWSDALQLMQRVTTQLMDYTQPNKLLGGIVIVAEDAQLELGRKIDQVSQYTYSKFKDVLEKELESTYQRITDDKTKADALDVMNDMKDAAEFLTEVPKIKKDMEEFDSNVVLMADAEASLQKLGYIFPEHWTYAAKVREEYTSLKDLMDRRMKALQLRRPVLIQSAKDAANDLDAKVKKIEEQLAKLDGDIAKKTPAAAQAVINDLHEQATELHEEGKRVSAIQESLGAPPINLGSLARVLADTTRLKEVWDHVTKAFATINRLGATPFFEVVPRRLQEDLQTIADDIDGYPEAVRSYQLCRDLSTQLEKLMGYRRLMQELRSDAMSPLERAQRHWVFLKQQLKAPWVLDSLTVQDIWDSDPAANVVIYNDVLEMAQGERRIEVQLHQISAYWESFEFHLTIYKKQVALIRGWDAVFEKLQDDLATFGGIRASPYFSSQQVVAMTNECEARLNRLRQVLEVLLEVQKRWVYLDGVFSDNSEIRAQLPHDTVQFDRTSRELMHVFPRPMANGSLPMVTAQFFLEDEKLLATLERLYGQLTAVQRALTTYLDTQRSYFPRFFFVGDDDLLEILGNSKDPTYISKHLRKMFTALATFTLDKPGNVAASNALRGFASLEGEEIHFKHPVEFKQRAMHEWLREAEDGMVVALRESTVQALGQLTSVNKVTLDWLDKFPSQMVGLAVQIWWVQLQESLFTSDAVVTGTSSSGSAPTSQRNSVGGSGTGTTSATSKVTEAMDALLAQLASSVLDVNLSPFMRHKCEQVITIAVYQRDVSRGLASQQVSSVKDFEWLSILRPYLTNAPVTQTTASGKRVSVLQQVVECRMADAALIHGFEYTGAYERLVQTPLTDKCYLTLMQAMHTRLGGSPVGPAGTGKTETVKALGLQLGRHVLVFNCDEAFDYQAVSRIFLGLCQVGAWGCFDEFNRLEERIMSALSQQIQVIQESLRARSPEVELNDHCVPLHDNVGIFITMNPGYAGRSNLPGNLKQLFRAVTMTIPDRETIAEVMLFAQGFHTAEKLSHKIVPLFRLCEEQFSRQAHYDFGLRALKSVLVAAGELKRKGTAQGSKGKTGTATASGGGGGGIGGLLSLRRGSADVSAVSTAEAMEDEECDLMLESLIANIAPKLVTQDVSLFYPLLSDFFPNRSFPEAPMVELREAIADVCEASGLTPALEWVEKICQLYHTKDTRHGIMIVGPSGTGKTTAWKALMSAMVRVDHSLEMHAYVIDPKVLTKGELFGSLDITTREWKDGVFTSILRKILEAEQTLREREAAAKLDSAEGKYGDASNGAGDPLGFTYAAATGEPVRREYWVVFDGDVDPEWVENLNSVLDDNKILTLPNGERLPLPKSMRVMFEAQNLRYATPATVSRCGMLWFSEGVIAFSSVLRYARHQLERKPICDVRGRRVRWNLEEDLVGLTYGASAATGGDSLSTGNGVITGHRGKTYSEYVVSCSSPNLEAMLGGTRKAGDVIDLNATAHHSNSGSGLHEDKFGAVAMAAMARKDTHPDAFRVKQAMMPVWSPAFGPNGLILKGVGLMVNSTKYAEATIMEFNVLEVLESIMALLLDGVWRTFRAQQESGAAFSDEVLVKIAQKTMDHAVFWGLGASMNYANRKSLEGDLGLAPKVGGVTKSMLDVEVDFITGEWRLVRQRVKETEILAEQVGANDTVIPTVDTCRHEDLLLAWLGAGRSAILCGPPGSGKTMSINAVLSSSPQYEAVFLNFSSGTNVDMVIKALEQYCTVTNTAHGFVMAPASGKKLLLFCDEINLPALNAYGTQVVLQLLRQLIERKGFYRPRDNAWIEISDIQVVGACNPPTDPGRVPLSARFLRWAPVLLVDFPSPESLLIIYHTYCRAILSFNKRLYEAQAKNLAEAMVSMYRLSQARFTPIQQPHYLYSPRELSRWSRAIYEGFLTWDDVDRKSMSAAMLVRLAVHEGLRVFSDRLVTQEERDWTDATIDDCFKRNFPNLPNSVYTRPMLYSTLVSRAYTDSSRSELRKLLQKKLPLFCEEEVSAPLVVFDAVIDHVVRIDRVLRQPLGHVLIAGSSGVGKTIIARLVAWLDGFSPFWLKVHRDYDLEDFEEDLRALLRRSGCKRERICFLFDESNIMQPAFLEYMNALLASGEVPGLFEGEEWPKLMQDIREAITATQSLTHASAAGQKKGGSGATGGKSKDGVAQAAAAAGGGGLGVGGAASAADAAHYLDMNNEQSLYRWFLNNVKEQLHVVFTINPSSSEFSSRTVASPALFNRCTVDWFGDWDMDTLSQITEERTRNLALLPVCGRAFRSEEDAHRALVQTICEIHQSTQEVNAVLRSRSANQGTHITPRHFSDLVSHFVKLLQEKSSSSSEQLQHLRSGLQKLEDTSKEVAAQQITLRENERRMAESSARSQTMLDKIVAETDVTKKERDAAEALRAQLKAEQDNIDDDAKQMQVDLAEAEPALKSAEMALNTVKPEYLREIRAYTTPPPMVKRVLEATCALLGEKNSDDWDILKSYIKRDDFLANVKAFKPDNITDSAKERVTAMMKDPKFSVDLAYRASKAAGPLLQWVFAQVQFSSIYKRVAPIRNKIMKLIETREIKVKALDKTDKEIRVKEEFLRQLKADYQATTQEINDLKHKTEVVSAKCERATTILHQLIDENKRWESEIKNFDLEARTTLGDCVVSAAFLAYIGYYDEFTRQNILLPRWTEYLNISAIPVRPHLSVMDHLISPTKRLQWEESGLPKDRLCLENATIMDRCERYTLLVDPAGTAARFLQSFYAQQKMKKASFSRPGYLKQLEMAVRFGYPIVLEDAELLDPAVAPLLNHEVRRTGGHLITRIGANDVEMSPTFKLFLLTRDPHYHPTPDLAGQVCVVNFTVTLSSLQSQCLHQILLQERPDTDKRRTELLGIQGESRLRLRVLEQNLLTTIAEAEGSLLENDALIKTLADLKNEARRIQGDITNSEAAMQVIERVEGHYRPVAAIASRVFFALKRFSELSSFYRFDVGFIFQVLQDALLALPPYRLPERAHEDDIAVGDEDVELARAHWLTNSLFTLVHRRVVRGMFKEDHLVLALRLAQLRSAVTFGDEGDSTRAGPSAAGPAPSPAVREDEWEWLLDSLRMGPSASATAATEGHASSTKAGASSPPGGDALVSLPSVLLKKGVLAVGKQGRLALYRLLDKPAFREIRQSLGTQSAAWDEFLHSAAPAEHMLELPSACFPPDATPVRKAFLVSLLLFYTRRDSFTAAVMHLLTLFFDGEESDGSPTATTPVARLTVETFPTSMGGVAGRGAFGKFFSQTSHAIREVLPELTSSTPLIMIADASYDPSQRVEQAAKEASVILRVVAMGSTESTAYADQFLEEGLKSGTWLLLKNIHLARDYLATVEKRLHFELLENRVHEKFRLLLTVERGPREDPRDLDSRRARRANVVPINLLESAVKVVYEAPPGLKSSLMQTYGALDERQLAEIDPSNNTNNAALRRSGVAGGTHRSPVLSCVQTERMLLAAAWLHAVIVERLSYVPLGWSQVYEFSDTEFLRVAQAVLAWSTEGASTNQPPVVSWPALRRIVSTTIYGGKVSNPFDERLFDVFCENILNTVMFDKDFVFVRPSANAKKFITSLPPPLEGFKSSRADLLSWVNSLPDGNSNPQWLGLPSGVARMLLARHALETVERLTAVQIILNEELASTGATGGGASPSASVKRGGTKSAGNLNTSVNSASGLGHSQSLLLPDSLDKVGMGSARWAGKVSEYAAAWRPGLQSILQKLEKHSFVSRALAAEDVARSTELISGVDAVRRSTSRDRGDSGTTSTKTTTPAGPVVPPLELAVQRECVALVTLLRHLVLDVTELEEVCAGTRKPSSQHRQLMEELTKDRIPAVWSAVLSSNTTTRTAGMLLVSSWVADVQQRAEHLLTIAEATFVRKLHQASVSLGLLCFPSAFLTAAKQQCARELKAPLELLTPQAELLTEAQLKSRAAGTTSTIGANAGALFLANVTLFSAQANEQGQGELIHANSAVTELATPVCLRWSWKVAKRLSSEGAAASSGSAQRSALGNRLASQRPFQATAALPFYVTEQRDALLEVVDLPIVGNGELDGWYERGACLSAWVPSE